MATAHLTPAFFRFLRELGAHNERAWFEANKPRYVEEVRDPLLAFIAEVGPKLKAISPHFVADPRPVGGSMFRIYRDTRFSKDKTPYKTHASAQFRHELAKDVHSPGFYLHLQPGQVFVGAGLWRPDGESVKKIRTAMAEDPGAWKRAVRSRRFSDAAHLAGDSLTRPPRGFDPDHPLIEDLKRKDFVAVVELDEKEACSPGFLTTFIGACRTGAPLVRFVCAAVEVPY
jgi:uncharacterized protein (TIGR02453 family)